MAKDPAFLFYSSDFLTGTMFMSDAEVGKYVRLLCAQHQHGGIIDKTSFDQSVGDNKMIRAKFKESKEGFFNERLANEMQLRKQKASKMSANAKQKHNKSIIKTDTIAHPIESVNENVIEDVLKHGLDEIYLDQERMKWPKIDFDAEVEFFKNKVRGSPQEYITRDSASIRLAFQYQLRNAKPKNNGSGKIGTKQQQTINTAIAVAEHYSDILGKRSG